MTVYIPKQGEIKADESLLNLIAIYAGEARNRYRSVGFNSIAAEADEVANAIHNALDAKGYYDDV